MNITLIGMAGAGKSTIGKGLAEKLGYAFVDIDTEIEKRRGAKLQAILDGAGDEEFIKIETGAVLELGDIKNTVISPGGSIIYSKEAMDALKKISRVIYLDVPLELIEKRIAAESRGIVGLKGRSIGDVLGEREMLYRQYADAIIFVGDKNKNLIIQEIISNVR